MKSRTLIVMWSSNGLESVIDATGADKKMMWATLKEDVHIDVFRLNAMVLRARFDSHQDCEIYAVDVDYETSVEEFKDLFSNDTNGSINLIKENGRPLFSE
jgi:hypothetical protein